MNAVTPTIAHLTTHDMAKQFGVTTRLLRFYGEIGLLQPVRFGNERRFTPRDQAFMPLIGEAQALGLTLTEIGNLMSKDRTRVEIPAVRVAELFAKAGEDYGKAAMRFGQVSAIYDAMDEVLVIEARI